MAIEGRRQSGYRKVGGLYIRGEGITYGCDRLNHDIDICPVCSNGIKFSRGFTWINFKGIAGKHENCTCIPECPICNPPDEKIGLMWIGGKFYTPDIFIAESKSMGISKRISNIPRDLVVGKTWILLAHINSGSKKSDPDCVKCNGNDINCICAEKRSAIFYAFRITAIEKLIWKKDATEDVIKKLESRGITPIIVPDDQKDHAKGEPEPIKPEGVSKKSKRTMKVLNTFDKPDQPDIDEETEQIIKIENELNQEEKNILQEPDEDIYNRSWNDHLESNKADPGHQEPPKAPAPVQQRKDPEHSLVINLAGKNETVVKTNKISQDEMIERKGDDIVNGRSKKMMKDLEIKLQEPPLTAVVPSKNEDHLYCDQCGSRIKKNSKFCHTCGMKVEYSI